MPLAFLSDDWFGRALSRLSELDGIAGLPDVCVQFSTPDGRHQWVEEVSGGRITGLRAGTAPDPDLEVQVPAGTLWGVLRGTLDGTEAHGSILVIDPTAPGEPHAPSPMDLGLGGGLEHLLAVPGASLAVQYGYSRGPFGYVTFSLSFEDGGVAAMTLGPVEDPYVTATCTYLQMAQVRRGDLGILDVLIAGGTITGSEGPLAMLGGISESPEFRAVEAACGRSGYVLGVLGEVHHGVGVAEAIGALMAETDPPPTDL